MTNLKVHKLTTILIILFSSYSFSQNKINVILIGTFHFNNPGNDAIKMKNRNILDKGNQLELERITNLIFKKYNPNQVFIEELFEKKSIINSEYNIFLNNNFHRITDSIKDPKQKKKYLENEIYQLAFRLAKKAKNDSIFPIDNLIEFRYDLLMKKANENQKIESDLKRMLSENSEKMNECMTKNSLSNVLLCINSEEERKRNKGMYISYVNKIGIQDNYFGSELVTGWYKRNLIMYSNFQNQVNAKSKNVVIIVGAGHAAMFYDFLKNDNNYNLIDLSQIL